MRLTKRLIDALEVTGKRYAVFDDDVTGFAIRVGVSGDKSFYLVYRAGKGRTAAKKWLRVGSFPTMTLEHAREIAKRKAAQVAMGQDPAEQVKDEKVAPFVKDALVVFFEQHGVKLKATTLRSYNILAERHVLPVLGKLKVVAVQYKHVATLHHTMRNTPYQANRCAALPHRLAHSRPPARLRQLRGVFRQEPARNWGNFGPHPNGHHCQIRTPCRQSRGRCCCRNRRANPYRLHRGQGVAV